MNKYEVVYIIDPAVEEEARKELIAKFNALITDNGGSVDKVEEWGKRRLAYAIDYKTEGYYVLVNFQAESELPKELERNLQISDSIIRYQVIRLLEKKASVKPRPVRTAPAAPAAEAVVETPAAE
ncbi:MAG: 30S ribosomal protein S6 [Clostridia bacterium]|nr:30S ribosomal protein S6 [Clostridia bacterium]